MNRKEIDRLHEINELRDRNLITGREYRTLRKELAARSQPQKERGIGWAESICVLSLALGLILSHSWIQVDDPAKEYEGKTSTETTNEQVMCKENGCVANPF